MDLKIWQDKAALLPEFVQQQIADYIDFLSLKYQQQDLDLSEAEKKILDERFESYFQDPDQGAELDVVKIRLLRKYGV